MAFPMRERIQNELENVEPMETDRLLSIQEAASQAQFVPQWKLNERSMERTLTFKDFRDAVEFVNRAADVAEAQDHHPDICIFDYNKVKLETSTHRAGGLTLNDFILASALDQVV